MSTQTLQIDLESLRLKTKTGSHERELVDRLLLNLDDVEARNRTPQPRSVGHRENAVGGERRNSPRSQFVRSR